MNPYMNRFQIRDLEEFSGVKAHTIRVWERRYGLLSPDRTDTNIRYYDLDDLKSILNVSYLLQNGYKISKVAALQPAERERLVNEVSLSKNGVTDVLNSLKYAMLSFDEVLFESVSSKYREKHGFRALVEEVYVPLLEHIGLLWQSNAICPAQEHFVSNLIRHKLIHATASLPLTGGRDRVFVLFLPENEIHELGLLYIDHILRARGERTIYLGQSVPTADLAQVAAAIRQPIVFVALLMAQPMAPEIPGFLKELRATAPKPGTQFWLAGGQLKKVDSKDVPEGMSLHGSLADLMKALDLL